MKLMRKVSVCVLGSWNKINPFITKYSKNHHFWNTFNTMRGIPYPYYDLWNEKADIVISSFNNELALRVHWWQRQAAVVQVRCETTNARLVHRTAQRSCSAFRGRTATAYIERLIYGQMFSVMFRRDEYFIYILFSIQSHWYLPTTNVGMRYSVDKTVHRWLVISVPRSRDTSLYLYWLS